MGVMLTDDLHLPVEPWAPLFILLPSPAANKTYLSYFGILAYIQALLLLDTVLCYRKPLEFSHKQLNHATVWLCSVEVHCRPVVHWIKPASGGGVYQCQLSRQSSQTRRNTFVIIMRSCWWYIAVGRRASFLIMCRADRSIAIPLFRWANDS